MKTKEEYILLSARQIEVALDLAIHDAKSQRESLLQELAEQERAKLRLIQETHNWSDAVKKLEAERIAPAAPCLSDCQAGRDGDCIAAGCPQLRDNEPERSGRSCPIYSDEDDD